VLAAVSVTQNRQGSSGNGNWSALGSNTHELKTFSFAHTAKVGSQGCVEPLSYPGFWLNMGLLQSASWDDFVKPAFLNCTGQGNSAETTPAIHWEEQRI